MTEALSVAEEELRRRAIGLEQYLEALAEQEGASAVSVPGGSTAVEEPAPGPGREPRRVVTRKESGVSVETLGFSLLDLGVHGVELHLEIQPDHSQAF
ncbi:hypothetical protein [Actinacidiphila glaucinigra]|uniref:hypothetical protein n=1 Tax=Actinacidiphila glaucinigra TaxID=235986 RepID=UPI00366C1B2B